MSIITKLLDRDDGPFTTDTAPSLKPTATRGLDASVIPLMLVTQRYGEVPNGVHKTFNLMQLTYLVEQHLVDTGIQVNQYDWDTCTAGDSGYEYAYSEQFYADLYAYPDHSPAKPMLYADDETTSDGELRRYYRPSGYTDLYVAKYFQHCEADRKTVEQHITELLAMKPEHAVLDGWFHDQLVTYGFPRGDSE